MATCELCGKPDDGFFHPETDQKICLTCFSNAEQHRKNQRRQGKCIGCGKQLGFFETFYNGIDGWCATCRLRKEQRPIVPAGKAISNASDHLPTPSNDPNTLGCFYEWILNSTIIFAACAFVISLFSYFTADNPIAEQINMGTLLISGTIVGLLPAMKWLMGAMSKHLANQAKIIELMNKKDGDE